MFKQTLKTMAMVMILGAMAACVPVSQPDNTLPTDQNTEQATGNLDVFTSDVQGFDTHSYYYDTGSEVVVFGAQFTPGLAQQAIDHIQAQTDSPIRYLVITHPNPDKFNGATAFQAIGAQVVASQATAQAMPAVHDYKKYYFVQIAGAFTDDNYPTLPTIDITFDQSMDLDLESGSVTLSTLRNSGVSSTQTVGWIESQRSLIVGDLVHHKAHAWLEGAIQNGAPAPNLDAWKQALNELLAFENATVYGGRGQSAPVQEAVAAQTQYLNDIDALVRQYVADLGERRSELQSDQAPQHHEALTQQIAQAFPDYTLPYMVQYSIYGLLSLY